jgi:hypothetical protein
VPTRPGSKLVVLLDQLVARRFRPVRVDPEGGDSERPSQRLPLELAEGRQRLDLVETND